MSISIIVPYAFSQQMIINRRSIARVAVTGVVKRKTYTK